MLIIIIFNKVLIKEENYIKNNQIRVFEMIAFFFAITLPV